MNFDVHLAARAAADMAEAHVQCRVALDAGDDAAFDVASRRHDEALARFDAILTQIKGPNWATCTRCGRSTIVMAEKGGCTCREVTS